MLKLVIEIPSESILANNEEGVVSNSFSSVDEIVETLTLKIQNQLEEVQWLDDYTRSRCELDAAVTAQMINRIVEGQRHGEVFVNDAIYLTWSIVPEGVGGRYGAN